MDRTYLDYNASAKVPIELLPAVEKTYFNSFGNPSSLHFLGRKSRKLINDTNELIGEALNLDPNFIFWTSGASEANSWAIHSASRLAQKKSKTFNVFYSAIEHESTLCVQT